MRVHQCKGLPSELERDIAAEGLCRKAFIHGRSRHYRAKEQQLRAKEEQLRAKEQQLRAKEQQLRAEKQFIREEKARSEALQPGMGP